MKWPAAAQKSRRRRPPVDGLCRACQPQRHPSAWPTPTDRMEAPATMAAATESRRRRILVVAVAKSSVRMSCMALPFRGEEAVPGQRGSQEETRLPVGRCPPSPARVGGAPPEQGRCAQVSQAGQPRSGRAGDGRRAGTRWRCRPGVGPERAGAAAPGHVGGDGLMRRRPPPARVPHCRAQPAAGLETSPFGSSRRTEGLARSLTKRPPVVSDRTIGQWRGRGQPLLPPAGSVGTLAAAGDCWRA